MRPRTSTKPVSPIQRLLTEAVSQGPAQVERPHTIAPRSDGSARSRTSKLRFPGVPTPDAHPYQPRARPYTPIFTRVSRVGAPGSWLLAPGSWLLAPGSGSWLLALALAPGSWLLAPGYWLLATSAPGSWLPGYWLLATGYWLLATGYWLLATGYLTYASASEPVLDDVKQQKGKINGCATLYGRGL